jgi:hypothetical protein
MTDETKMKQAIEEVKQGESISSVAKKYDLSKATLSRHVKRAGDGVSQENETPTVNETASETLAMDETAFQFPETDVPKWDETPESETGSTVVSVGDETDVPARLQELETLVASFQSENETLRNELTALKEKNETAPPESPDSQPVGDGLPGVTIGNTSYYWSAIADMKAWVEEMGQSAPAILEKTLAWRNAYCDWMQDMERKEGETLYAEYISSQYKNYLSKTMLAYTQLRRHIEPAWSPFTALQAWQKENDPVAYGFTGWPKIREKIKTASGKTKDELVMELSEKLVAVISADTQKVTASPRTAPEPEQPAPPDLATAPDEYEEPEWVLARLNSTATAEKDEDAAAVEDYRRCRELLYQTATRPALILRPIAWLVDRLRHRN